MATAWRRFVRQADADPGSESGVGASTRISRFDLSTDLEAHRAGGFLGRLWTHFGPPEPMDYGFSYALFDRETAIRFTAYSGASGPAYAAVATREAFLPVVQEFEGLLARTIAADCAIEVDLEIDYGGGRIRIGTRDGQPFEEKVKRGPGEEAVRGGGGPKTYEDCLARAEKAGEDYDVEQGWHLALREAMPDPPDAFVLDGQTYENCIGFWMSRGKPVYGFDEGSGIVEIPLERIPWKRPLPAKARLWLTSFERWQEERKTKGR
jgi:hypothetical protein